MTVLRTFTCSYDRDGRMFVKHVAAASFEDAELRLVQMGIDGEVDGELVAEWDVSVDFEGTA